MAANEISVALKLELQGLRDQVAAAAKSIKAGLSADLGKATKGTDDLADAQSDLEKKITKTNKALSEQKQRLKDIASGKLSPVEPGMKISIAGATSASNKVYGPGASMGPQFGNTLATQIAKQVQPLDNGKFKSIGRSIQAQLMNPALPSAGAIPAPATAKAGFRLSGRQGMALLAGVGMGVPGLGAAASLAGMGPTGAVMAAAVVAIQTARKAAEMMAVAAAQARSYYNQAARSGTGLGFTVARSNLSQVLGVSEQEVMQFGRSIEFIRDRLSSSNRIFVETTPQLTALRYQFEVTKLDIQAFGATIAKDLAPAMQWILEIVSKIAKKASEGRDAAKTAEKMAGWFIGGGILGYGLAKESQFAAAKGNMAAPDPMAYMKQLGPFSALERMGLVIGGVSTTNYQQQTAQNTARTASWLEKLFAKLGAPEHKEIWSQTAAMP